MNPFLYKLGKQSVLRPYLIRLHKVYAWIAAFVSFHFYNVKTVLLIGGTARGEITPGLSDIDLILVLKKDIQRISLLDFIQFRWVLRFLIKVLPLFSYPLLVSPEELKRIYQHLFFIRTHTPPLHFKWYFKKSKNFNPSHFNKNEIIRKMFWYFHEYQKSFHQMPKNEFRTYRLARSERRLHHMVELLGLSHHLSDKSISSWNQFLLITREIEMDPFVSHKEEFEVFSLPKSDSVLHTYNQILESARKRLSQLLKKQPSLPIEILLVRDGVLSRSEELFIIPTTKALSSAEFLNIANTLEPLLKTPLKLENRHEKIKDFIDIYFISREYFETCMSIDIERHSSLFETGLIQTKYDPQTLGINKDQLFAIFYFNWIHLKKDIFDFNLKRAASLERFIFSTVYIDLILNHNKIVLDLNTLFEIYRRVSPEKHRLAVFILRLLNRHLYHKHKMTLTDLKNSYQHFYELCEIIEKQYLKNKDS